MLPGRADSVSQSGGVPAKTTGTVDAYVQANGIRIYYEVSGAGEPLVLLHGGTESSGSWSDDVAIFAQQYRVFALDLRGHGRTENPAGQLSYPMMAEDVVAFCAALGIPQAVLCGHRDGGNVALEIGVRHPALPRALILSGVTSSSPERYTAVLQPMLQQVVGGGSLPVPADIAKLANSSNLANLAKIEQRVQQLLQALRSAHDTWQGPDAWKNVLSQAVGLWNTPLGYKPEDFRFITAPTLVLLGDRDEALPIEEAVALYRALPNAELAILPSAGHGFTPYMRSIAFDFLRRQRTQP
jgi:pimeloyl-ACP methyl ester carboxylesterase